MNSVEERTVIASRLPDAESARPLGLDIKAGMPRARSKGPHLSLVHGGKGAETESGRAVALPLVLATLAIITLFYVAIVGSVGLVSAMSDKIQLPISFVRWAE